MSVSTVSAEEESFIILGSSPGVSLEQGGGAPVPSRDSGPEALKMNEMMKEFTSEGSLAFKAHFNLENESPSASSVLMASSMMSSSCGEDTTLRLAELIDENVILRETLRTNNSSLMDKMQLIASCQEDMMRTHRAHKDKFRETRELVEKLRAENRKLKEEVKKLHSDSKPASQSTTPQSSLTASQTAGSGAGSDSDGRKIESSLAYEFVACPDEDTLNKLTAQLELVERQRRQVIAENEKLTWQKESLEHIVDVTTKERDSIKDQLRVAQLEGSTKEQGLLSERQSLKNQIKDLQSQLLQSESLGSVGAEEMLKRDSTIHTLETKISGLQAELKAAQLRLLDMENLKLEVSRLKHGSAETGRLYREQLQELQGRLKEAQTTVFQPVRFSISSESEQGSEFCRFNENVKLYDKSLKHLSELLNSHALGASESLAQTLELAVQASLLKIEECTPDQLRSCIAQLKTGLEAQHSAAVQSTGQVRATISIFEKIFQDYKDLLKTLVTSKNNSKARSSSMDALTAALVSRDQQLQNSADEVNRLRALVATLQRESDEREHLRAQLDVYKADFEAERASREKLASDKDSIMSDLRGLQRRNQSLTEQLEEVRRINPNIFQHATGTTKRGYTTPRTTSGGASTVNTPSVGTGNMVYTCPKCNAFSCDQYKVIEDHVQICLDN